jgi:hypothetical protein
VYLPGLDDVKIIRGEFLEIELDNTYNGQLNLFRYISFDVKDVLANDISVLKNGCLEVYLELSFIPKNTYNFKDDKCNSDHDNPILDEVFSNTEVLKIKPGFDYSSVADPSSMKFNDKSYVYKESDGEFFHQKDIELVEQNMQNLDIELLQNFETSSHMLGLIIEAPLEGNNDVFMHGESQPDCVNNECIYSDKGFNTNYISYVFNSNIISRVRLWFYKLHTLPASSSVHRECTPYHFTIKSTKNYLETHSKENVACINEVFPSKLTSRRYAHKEMPDAYIIDDEFRVDSFTDVSFSRKFCVIIF